MRILQLLTLLAFASLPAFGQANRTYTIFSFGGHAGTNHDSYAVFTNAIARVAANGGGTLYVPGFFAVSKPIPGVVGGGVTLQGDATINANLSSTFASGITLLPGANCPIIQKEIGQQLNLQGLIFLGNRANQTATNYLIWYKGTNSTIDASTITDCCVFNANGVGFRTDNRQTLVYRTIVLDSNGDGIYNTASSDTVWEDVQSGFNNGVGMNWNGVNYSRLRGGDFYRNVIGMVMTNCSNNGLYDLQTDANEREGMIISSGSPNFSTGNDIFGAKIIVGNFTYTHNYTPLTVSSVPNGTYYNLEFYGDNTIADNFFGGRLYSYENINIGHQPKGLIGDFRPFYMSNDFQGLQLSFTGTQVTTNTAYFAGSEAYSTNWVRYGDIAWYRDFSRQWKDNTFLRQLSVNQEQISDQLESANGVQGNAYFDGAWKYRANGPATWFQARTDTPVAGLLYAPLGTASNALAWTKFFNWNTTNGNVGVAKGETPAITPLEVEGTIKSSLAETRDGLVFNAVYNGGWKYRENGFAGLILFQQSGASTGNMLFYTAASGVAGGAITFNSALQIDPTGNVSIPTTLAVPLMTLTALNTSSLTVSNNITFKTTNAVPSVTNAVLWVPVTIGSDTNFVMPVMRKP